MGMFTPSFRFGPQAEHEVRLKCGYLLGERYFVDGVEALHLWLPRWSGVREFTAQGHLFQIHVKAGFRSADVRAFVDGALVCDDVYAELNAWGRAGRERRAAASKRPFKQKLGRWLLKFAAWFVLTFALLTAFRSCDATARLEARPPRPGSNALVD